MSFYSDYLKERTDQEILETDKGFATYRFPDEKTCYLMDIYVAPLFRREGVASDIADMVMDIAKRRGCSKLLGSVVPSTKGSTASLKALMGYGMTLQSSAPDFILFERSI